MPRELSDCSFRAVINRKGKRVDDTDYSYDVHYGPYKIIGTAKGILTKELNWAERPSNKLGPKVTVTGWIEQAQTKWEKVEEID